MLKLTLLLLCVLHLLFGVPARATPTTYKCNPSDRTIKTTSGLIRGTCLSSTLHAYLGIPYAQPPVGALRFQPPQPFKSPSKKVIDASRYGKICIQYRFRGVFPTPLDGLEEGEDCLTINVFVPTRGKDSDDSKLRPVMLWFHGGGFTEGSSVTSDPQHFLRSNPDIIVVNFNYRLNFFGFPNTPALENDVANPGLHDQRFAVQWVHDNIRQFGGDPDRVVLAGYSAGSASVASYLYAYPDTPFAAGAIMMSGSTSIIGSNDYTEWDRVAKTVECYSEDKTQEMECMRKIDAKVLRRAMSNETLNEFGTGGGVPRYDNVTVFPPQVIVQKGIEGDFAKIPILLGNTENEADNILPWTPRGINHTFSDIFTTTAFHCPNAMQAYFHTLHNVPTYRYRFRGTFPSYRAYPWLRSYHALDLFMLFGGVPNDKQPLPVERAAISYLQSAVAAFIKDPAAGLGTGDGKFGWPVYNSTSTSLVELFRDNTVNAQFTSPAEYDYICQNPPVIPWEQFAIRPPPCDPCYDVEEEL